MPEKQTKQRKNWPAEREFLRRSIVKNQIRKSIININLSVDKSNSWCYNWLCQKVNPLLSMHDMRTTEEQIKHKILLNEVNFYGKIKKLCNSSWKVN